MDKFEEYLKDVETATNEISLKKSSTTNRTGSSKWRDRLMYGRVAWQEALAFVAIIQTIIIFVALIPQSVLTVNGFLTLIGLSYQFPIHIASLIVIIFIIFVFVFGLIAVRYIGTFTSVNEISTKMYPAYFLLWKQMKNLEKKVVELENKKDIGNGSSGIHSK